MILVRVVVGVLAVAGAVTVLGSAARTVVVPRAEPARLARIAFLSARALLLLRLRLTGRSDYETRDRVFALQSPLSLLAQLVTWGVLTYLSFAALFWSLTASRISGASVASALDLSGSSMLTLGFDSPSGLVRQLTAFAAASVGLTLLALVIAYLPTLYGAFSRRESLVTKLSVRTDTPPSGPALLARTWELERFDHLEEVWDPWEDWFIDVGQTHTTFPQLSFFRSPHGRNHWVLAAETVLDGASLLLSACDVPRRSRSELCLKAGIHCLISMADFLGIPHHPPQPEAEIALPREKFDAAFSELRALGVPMQADRDKAWSDFRTTRARYESLLAVIGRMTDAPRSEWSSWSEATPRHRPPLWQPKRGRERPSPG
jgi:hypothetical protein